MYQPQMRPQSLEEIWAEEAEREDASALAREQAVLAEIDGRSSAQTVAAAPMDPCEWTWEDLERSIAPLRRAEGRLIANLLAAWRAAEDDTIATFGTSSVELNGDLDRAFRAEAALALDMGDAEVTTLVWHADLGERWLPRTWAALLDGRLGRRAFQTILREMDGLDLDLHAAAYDEAAVDAIERTRGPRLRFQMHSVRERLQADTAARRRKKAESRHGTQVDVARDGLASWVVTGPADQILAAEDAVERQAIEAHGRPGETRSIGQLKVAIAMGQLLHGVQHPNPELGVSAVVPTVSLTVPVLTLLGLDAAPAVLDGYGPIDIETARALMGDATCLSRVLTDPISGVPLTMDRSTYRIRGSMRRWLRFRDGTCRFPGCGRRASRCDLDHRDEWHDGGCSDDDNLAHLCRKHHRWKSRGLFTIRRDAVSGDLAWAFPSGRIWVSRQAAPQAPTPKWLTDLFVP